jgi:hypothetical protein
MSLSKKFNCKGTLWQVFFCLRPPPLIGFLFGEVRQCCRFWIESGHIQSVKLLHNMASNTIQHPPPPIHTLAVNTVLWLWEGVGEVNKRETLGFNPITVDSEGWQMKQWWIKYIQAKIAVKSKLPGQLKTFLYIEMCHVKSCSRKNNNKDA